MCIFLGQKNKKERETKRKKHQEQVTRPLRFVGHAGEHVLEVLWTVLL